MTGTSTRPWFSYRGRRVRLEPHESTAEHGWTGWQFACPGCGECCLFAEDEVEVAEDGALTVGRVECPTTTCEISGRIVDGEFLSTEEGDDGR